MGEEADLQSPETVEVPAEEVVTTEVVTETVQEAPSVEADEAADSEETLASLRGRLSEEDYAYVVKVREQAGRYRTERNRFKDVFEGYDDDTVDAYLEAVKAIKTDPAAAHAAFSELAAALAEAAGITEEEAADVVDDAAEDEDEDLSFEERLDKALAARKEAEETAKAEQDSADVARKEVDDTIESLGYRPGTVEFQDLLFYASQETDGSVVDKLNAAHAAVQDRNQAIIDAYVNGEAQKLDVSPPQTDGAPVAPARPGVKSIKDGAKGAKAALDAIYSEAESE